MPVVSPSSLGDHWVQVDVSHHEHSEMTMITKEQIKILKGENVFMSVHERRMEPAFLGTKF